MLPMVRNRAKRLMAGACLVVATLFAGDARATVIDFESIPACTPPYPGLFSWCDVGLTHSEDGFVLTAIGSAPAPFLSFGTTDPRYAGSKTLYNANDLGITRLARDGGGLFGITSIDLATDARFASAPITFVGTLADGFSTVQRSFEITSGALSTFALPNTFEGLLKLEWTQVSPYHQFDNIVVTAAGAVPEPGLSLTMTVGLWVAGAALRRSRNV